MLDVNSSWCKKELGVFAHVILTCFVIKSAKTKSGSVKKDEAVRTLVMQPSESRLNSIEKWAMLILELDGVGAVEDYFDSFALYCKFSQDSCDQIISQTLWLFISADVSDGASRFLLFCLDYICLADNKLYFIDILVCLV